jgi:hypothetical protein
MFLLVKSWILHNNFICKHKSTSHLTFSSSLVASRLGSVASLFFLWLQLSVFLLKFCNLQPIWTADLINCILRHIWQPSKYGQRTDAIVSQVRQACIANQQNLTLPAITSSCKYIKMWPKPYGALDFSFWQVLVLYLSMIEITNWAYIEGQSPWLYDWDASVFIAASLCFPSPLCIPLLLSWIWMVFTSYAMYTAGSARTVGLVHSSVSRQFFISIQFLLSLSLSYILQFLAHSPFH